MKPTLISAMEERNIVKVSDSLSDSLREKSPGREDLKEEAVFWWRGREYRSFPGGEDSLCKTPAAGGMTALEEQKDIQCGYCWKQGRKWVQRHQQWKDHTGLSR